MLNKLKHRRWFKAGIKIFPVLLGAALGYLYYAFVGCYNGACPISSNPYISTVYGALAGAVFLIPGKKKD